MSSIEARAWPRGKVKLSADAPVYAELAEPAARTARIHALMLRLYERYDAKKFGDPASTRLLGRYNAMVRVNNAAALTVGARLLADQPEHDAHEQAAELWEAAGRADLALMHKCAAAVRRRDGHPRAAEMEARREAIREKSAATRAARDKAAYGQQQASELARALAALSENPVEPGWYVAVVDPWYKELRFAGVIDYITPECRIVFRQLAPEGLGGRNFASSAANAAGLIRIDLSLADAPGEITCSNCGTVRTVSDALRYEPCQTVNPDARCGLPPFGFWGSREGLKVQACIDVMNRQREGAKVAV